MKCPNCDRELEKEFYEKVVVFRCPECGGRLATISGLRTLCADRAFVNLLWNTARNGYSENGPACGVCRKPMRRVTLPLAGVPLELDLCCSCQMVWFDPAELERIPLPKPEEQEDLPPKVRELWAMHQIQAEEARLRGELREYGGDCAEAPDEGWKHFIALFGMPVELNAPECRRRPLVTWGIALACLLVFVLTYSHSRETIDAWGFISAQWNRRYGLTLLTSMFLHGGVLHLIGNLYFLLIFGDNVEDELGKCRYILLILASGLCASLFHACFDHRTAIPCIGASGFISGVIACYAVCFPRVRLSFMLTVRNFSVLYSWRRYWFSLPAWGAFVVWVILQILLMALAGRSANGGVAYLAHIGGVFPGIAWGIWYRYSRKDSIS